MKCTKSHINFSDDMAFRTFHKKLMSFIKYTRLMKNLDTRLEDATQEEITATGR